VKNHFRFLFVSMMLNMLVVDARTIKVVVASQSLQKITAVKASFSKKFPDDELVYFLHKTFSGVPDQPVGAVSAMQGVRNRLDSLPKNMVADYVVAIESYIEQSSSTHRWYDKGLVVIKQGSQEYIMESQSVFIPDEYVQLAQTISGSISEYGYSATVGMAIEKSFLDKNIDPNDWHKEVEFGNVSRQQILQDVLDKILHDEELKFLKSLVLIYPDFPKVGIAFANFLPIVHNSQAFRLMIDLLAQRYRDKNIDVIVGLESRGFIIGAALAYELGVSFVPVRKPGKLPGPIYSVDYKKEYGFDTLVIAQDGLKSGQRVLIVDDLIATGGSARASIELVRLAGGDPVEFASLLKVAELEEQAILSIPSFNLID